ncbi:MAG TPA: DoxX-like family protein, partial [Chloroflexota bacterium]|nr:DoxX-like family protein [Chloroflexota bacterium]
SALRFWSDDPKSLIRRGSDYWRYVPSDAGVLFLTGYDYDTRYSVAGRLVDQTVFRPLLGWATGRSFARLRLWAETGLDPAVAIEWSVTHAVGRIALTPIWLYQGLVPKLLVPDSGELAILAGAGLAASASLAAVRLLGAAEIAFGVALPWLWRSHRLFILHIERSGAGSAWIGRDCEYASGVCRNEDVRRVQAAPAHDCGACVCQRPSKIATPAASARRAIT